MLPGSQFDRVPAAILKSSSFTRRPAAGSRPSPTAQALAAATAPSGTGGSAADHRLTATCATAMTAPARIREPLTYASTPFEVVDWSLFGVIGVDHCRNSKVEDRYAETTRRYPG